MGLDSVEILMGWERAFGIPIEDHEAKAIRTPQMGIDLICQKLSVQEGASSDYCLSARAFHKVRRELTARNIPRSAIKPSAKFNPLFSHCGGRAARNDFRETIGLPRQTFLGTTFNTTVRTAVHELITTNPRSCMIPDEPWTRSHVRTIVRAVTEDIIGTDDFSDTDDFIHDLRID